MRRIGLRHYGAKTVDLSDATDWESVVTEIFVGFLLGVFAYMGYIARIPLLFFPCLIGSAVCFYTISRNAFFHFRNKTTEDKCNNKKSQQNHK